MTTTAQPAASGIPTSTATTADGVSDRLFGDAVGAFHLQCVYVGDRLGLFEAIDRAGSVTAAELAEQTGLDPRYVREWIQAEATAGLLLVESGDVDRGQCSLAEGVADVLVDRESPYHLAGLPVAVAASGRTAPLVIEAFRSGSGVPYAHYGPEAVEAQEALNRPAFVHSLTQEWLPAMEDVVARLRSKENPARVADLGCGAGWAAISLAESFPHVRIVGLDADEDSIARARHNASERGVTDRVTFEVADITKPIAGQYDLVMLLECVHDLSYPAAALEQARAALAPGGAVLVADERAAEKLTPGDPIETFFATVSVMWCFPQSRVMPHDEATGTVMRESTLRELAERTGYTSVDVLPIDHPFFRFYRLFA